MKVLHLRSEYLDNGPGTQPIKIAKEFIGRGIVSYFGGAKGFMDDVIRKEGFEFIEVEELSRKRRDPLSIIKSIFKVRKIIKDREINVIHTHNLACSFVAFFASKFTGRKINIVRSVRGIELRPTHQYRNMLYRFYPAKLLAVCEFAKESLINLGVNSNKIIVTYNGADLSKFDKNMLSYDEVRDEYGVCKNEVLIGHVGVFSGWKGQDVLIKALKLLKNKTDIPVKLMLVGDGPSFKETKLLAEDLNVIDDVIFVGKIAESEKHHMSFDIYSQPSIKGELFPNSIVEALALGKPWVGSNISGLPELSENGQVGVVVPPDNEFALCDALLPLVVSKELRAKMGNNAYDLVLEKFTIEKVCDRILKAYLAL